MVARRFAALVVLALLAPQPVQAQLPDHLRCFRITLTAEFVDTTGGTLFSRTITKP
jgi:hypothetical protein